MRDDERPIIGVLHEVVLDIARFAEMKDWCYENIGEKIPSYQCYQPSKGQWCYDGARARLIFASEADKLMFILMFPEKAKC